MICVYIHVYTVCVRACVHRFIVSFSPLLCECNVRPCTCVRGSKAPPHPLHSCPSPPNTKQSCVAACDEALASECLSPSPPIPPTSSSTGGGLIGPPPPPPPRAHRAQALFWRARARSLSVEGPAAAAKGEAAGSVRSALSVEPAAAKGEGVMTATVEQQGQGEQHRRYVMQLALKDLAEAVRLEPGNRAIRWVNG